jgi:hypothetical protein
MQATSRKSSWDSHDWKVKTLEALASGGGSRLRFTCRNCFRKFSYASLDHTARALNEQDFILSDEVTSRWLAQPCPGHPGEADDNDRLQLRNLR